MTDADTDAVTDEVADESDPTAEVATTPSSPRTPRTVPASAFLVVVVLAVALGVLAVIAASLDTGSGAGTDDQDVRLAAGRFSEAFLTFEHDDLDGWKSTVLSLSTGAFADEVENVEAGLRQLISSNELSAQTQVTDVFVGQVERGSVDVVVIYDRTVDGSGGPRRETNRYMQLSLVDIDGTWLVDNVIDIATTGGLAPVADQPE